MTPLFRPRRSPDTAALSKMGSQPKFAIGHVNLPATRLDYNGAMAGRASSIAVSCLY
jgi:hypothetical protein